MIDYMDTAEDFVIDDEAEEIEDAFEDLIEDDYSDIDNIADIDDESSDDDFDDDDFEDDDEFDDDEDDYVDYEV